MADSPHVDLWKRIGAFIIDFIILYTIIPLFFAILFILIKTPPPSVTDPKAIIVSGMIFLTAMWLYFAISESSSKQASLGKRLFRIMVIDLEGNRISFLKASLRFWGKFTIFPGFSLTGLIFRKRALHDLMASTIVTNKTVISLR